MKNCQKKNNTDQIKKKSTRFFEHKTANHSKNAVFFPTIFAQNNGFKSDLEEM